MEKQSLNRFVSKYNLAGLVESVKWESKEGSLTTSFISDDKSVLGSVSMKEFDGNDTSFGVYDTTKLTKMLSVLGDDVDFSINDIDGKPVSLKFKETGLPSISLIEKSTSSPRTDNIFVSLVVSYTPKDASVPSNSFILTLPKTDLSSEMNDVVREPSFDSHFTDSTKPARLYFDTKRFNDCFSMFLLIIIYICTNIRKIFDISKC